MAGAHDHPSGRVPFWIHQLVELLLGVLLMVQGARTGEHTAVLVSLGGLLLLLALCSDGALGAWPWIGRRVHRVLDLVVAVLLAVSPLVFGIDHVLAVVLLEIAAGAMLWLALRTAWRTEHPGPGGSPTPAPLAPAAPPPQPASAPAPPSPPVPDTPGAPPLARKLGRVVGRARDDGPRRAGRLVGRAQRAAAAALASDPSPPPAPEPANGTVEPPDTGPPAPPARPS